MERTWPRCASCGEHRRPAAPGMDCLECLEAVGLRWCWRHDGGRGRMLVAGLCFYGAERACKACKITAREPGPRAGTQNKNKF